MQILVEIGWIAGPWELPQLNLHTKAWGSVQYIFKLDM